MIMRNKKDFIYYLLAMICVIAFFINEFQPKYTSEYLQVFGKYQSAKKVFTDVLEELKTSQKGTMIYEKYIIEKRIKDISKQKYLDILKKEQFLAFTNFKQFLGEFGWALGLFIYSIFNLTLALVRKGESLKGQLILHTTFVFISMYFINWCLIPHDYSREIYFVYAILMTSLILLGTYLLIKSKFKYILHLQNSIRLFFLFLYKDAEERQLINPDKQKDFRKIRLEITDKIVGDE